MSTLDDLRAEYAVLQDRLAAYDRYPESRSDDQYRDAKIAVLEMDIRIREEGAKGQLGDALVEWMRSDQHAFSGPCVVTIRGDVATAKGSSGESRQFVLRDGRFAEVPNGEICGPH